MDLSGSELETGPEWGSELSGSELGVDLSGVDRS